jgi:HD-GYP domain-containing protein (c-di-GMP phosphodiesterase class II)
MVESKGRYLLSWRVWVLALACLGINVGTWRLTSLFQSPFYFDTIGTYIAAALCGAIPGMAVAFFTNLLEGIWNQANIFYAFVSVIAAVTVSFFAQRRKMVKWWQFLVVSLIVGLLSGLIDSIATWLFNGFGIETASFFYPQIKQLILFGLHPFFAQALWTMAADLMDKTVSMIPCAVLLLLLPAKALLLFPYGKVFADRKKPTEPEEKASDIKMSIRTKGVILTSFINVVLAALVGIVSGVTYRSRCVSSYSSIARSYSTEVAELINGEKIDSYISLGEKADLDASYVSAENTLYKLFNSSSDITYMYVVKILPDYVDPDTGEKGGVEYVFDLDTSSTPGNTCGYQEGKDASFAAYWDKLTAGEDLGSAILGQDAYLSYITYYTPIKDNADNTVAYGCVDIDLVSLTSDTTSYLAKLFSLLFCAFVFVTYLYYYYLSNTLIEPLSKVVKQTEDFNRVGVENWLSSEEWQNRTPIESGDEVEKLYKTICDSEVDITESLEKIETQAATMLRMERNIVIALADMVEARDQNTGDHIRRTSFYVQLIVTEMLKDKCYPQVLTPLYAQQMIQAAPLHDVGKIKIPDSVLNKPGKLSDSEFAVMRSHTLEGEKIIAQALEGITGDTYLEVAKEVAAYHHEKWDGSGYMKGLKGEQIPLSARIMAVADVFDALVSKRSYKEPFSYQKSIEIIKEESGTHFDPIVVTAFLAVQGEVKKSLGLDEEGNPCNPSKV